MSETRGFSIDRAKTTDAPAIAQFVAQATRGRVAVDAPAVMERFGTKGLWLVRDTTGGMVGLAGWRAENLIARIDDFLIFPPTLYPTAGRTLVDAIEGAARELQCEVSMVLVPLHASPRLIQFYENCGYERPEPEELPRVWQETLEEATTRGRFVMLRQLREDLVLRPI
jgi:N-acetylglutamate synthase-like GNAT family acetyltransferase